MLFARKIHEQNGRPYSTDWEKDVTNLLGNSYAKECQRYQRDFSVYSFVYPDEFLTIISFADERTPESLPVSCFISLDLPPETLPEKYFDLILDFSGVLLDTLFEDMDKDEIDYSSIWTENEFNGTKIFYKLSRENIILGIAASQLLDDKKKL